MNDIRGFFGEHRWLSNFWDCSVVYESLLFPSVEHAYVYTKGEVSSVGFDSLVNMTAAEAKTFGRSLTLYDDFEDRRLDIMQALINNKFSNTLNPILVEKLIKTDDAELVEVNTWGDRFWGADTQGRGANHLGKAIMRRREQLEAKEWLI